MFNYVSKAACVFFAAQQAFAQQLSASHNFTLSSLFVPHRDVLVNVTGAPTYSAGTITFTGWVEDDFVNYGAYEFYVDSACNTQMCFAEGHVLPNYTPNNARYYIDGEELYAMAQTIGCSSPGSIASFSLQLVQKPSETDDGIYPIIGGMSDTSGSNSLCYCYPVTFFGGVAFVGSGAATNIQYLPDSACSLP